MNSFYLNYEKKNPKMKKKQQLQQRVSNLQIFDSVKNFRDIVI
jgi:hypothetical protein